MTTLKLPSEVFVEQAAYRDEIIAAVETINHDNADKVRRVINEASHLQRTRTDTLGFSIPQRSFQYQGFGGAVPYNTWSAKLLIPLKRLIEEYVTPHYSVTARNDYEDDGERATISYFFVPLKDPE